MRQYWLTNPAQADLGAIIDQITPVNKQGARNVVHALEEHLDWLAATSAYRPKIYMSHRGYDIHRASFGLQGRYDRYEFFFILREEDVVAIACDYAQGAPERVRAHVAGAIEASETEL